MSSSPATRPQESFNPDAPAVAIDASGLTFRYGERTALDAVGFQISRGEMFGFLGPNGGGKTTLFRLLSTLVPLQSGTVQILGSDLSRDTRALRRRIGVVFQHPSIDGRLTVAENLAHHGRLFGMWGNQLRVEISTQLERLGLTNRARDIVDSLSGGLKRRVELAKALLHKPDLLLLDEPSTGLDPAARREFAAHLHELRARDGVTVVITTHYLEEAERCDRLAILDRGKLIALAPPGELKSQVGGDVLVIHTNAADMLQRKLLQKLKLKSVAIDGSLRIERPRGHEIIRELVETFGDEIESISFGKPTLEDVFVHLTGHEFIASPTESN